RTDTATTVRVENGKGLTIDGPFAETKEQLAGYYVLDCTDLNEAIAWAARIPTTCGGTKGSIEIRQLGELPGGPESILKEHPQTANASHDCHASTRVRPDLSAGPRAELPADRPQAGDNLVKPAL